MERNVVDDGRVLRDESFDGRSHDKGGGIARTEGSGEDLFKLTLKTTESERIWI